MALTCPRCQTPGVSEAEALLSLRLGTPFACLACGQRLRQVHASGDGKGRASGREGLITLASAGAFLLWVWLGRRLSAVAFAWVEADLFGKPASVVLGRLLFYGGLVGILYASVMLSAASMEKELRRDSTPAPWKQRRWDLRRLARIVGFGLLVVLALQMRVFTLLRKPALLVVVVVLVAVTAHTALVTVVAWSRLRRREAAAAGPRAR